MKTTQDGVKYSKELAKNETSSRKQIERLELSEKNMETEEYTKSLYQFNVAYSTIFDGLSLACTHFYDSKWQDEVETWHDIIGRKDDITETHYRLFAPESFIKEIFVGPFTSDWPNVRNQLLKLAYKPQPKKLIISKSHYIIDAPIKVTPWYENDDIEKFTNLSPRRKGKTKEERNGLPRETGKARGKIVGFSIEFFKPVFEHLLKLGETKTKTIGINYLLTPPYFQLKLNHMYNGIVQHPQAEMRKRQKEFVTRAKEIGVTKKEKEHALLEAKIFERSVMNKLEKVTALDVRKFYLALALKDNRKGKYITIDDFVGFIHGIWPELIRNNTIQPVKYDEAIEKIETILKVYFRIMAEKGDMDGGQIVPLAIIPKCETTREEFSRETNKLRIQCIKKKSLFSKYTVEEIGRYLTS